MGDRDEMYFTDDLEQIARKSMEFAGKTGAYEPRPFARLAAGKTLGKRVVINVAAVGPNLVNTADVVDMLEVRGDDSDAMQLGLTLCPPLVMPTAGLTLPANFQDINGQMSSEQMLALPAFVYGRCEALIEWGIGGLTSQVNADFLNGLILNLQASWVRVRGIFQSEGAVTAAAYQIGVFVGPASAAPSRAQLSQEVGAINNGGAASAMFAIPRFARSVRLFITGPMLATDDFNIELHRTNVAVSLVGNVRFLGAAGSSPYFPPITAEIALPGNAYFYRIINNGGGAIRVRAVFDLAI